MVIIIIMIVIIIPTSCLSLLSSISMSILEKRLLVFFSFPRNAFPNCCPVVSQPARYVKGKKVERMPSFIVSNNTESSHSITCNIRLAYCRVS